MSLTLLRHPHVPAATLLAGLVPPRHFAGASFDTYVPDPGHPSQQRARDQQCVALGRTQRA